MNDFNPYLPQNAAPCWIPEMAKRGNVGAVVFLVDVNVIGQPIIS